MQNIGGENAGDSFYRYKMPKLVAKIEGRGNGIKTNVVNNVDIAKALERPPEYILKFYGCELGAQTNFDKTTGTSIVNGAHDTRKLCELLESFIKKYVQCYSCGNPETVVKIKKDFIHLKCKACGFVSDVDMRHKVNTFILKNPPENKLSKEERRLKKAEEERMRDALESASREKKEKKKKDKEKKDKKKKKDKNGDDANGGGDDDEDEEDGGEEGGEGGAAENGKAAKAAGGSKDGDDDDDDDEEDEEEEVVWMTDTSASAVAARAAEQLTAATAAMVTQGNIEAEAAERKKQAKREAKKRREAEQQALRDALESGDKMEPAAAEAALRALLAEAGWDWSCGSGGPAAIAKVASGGLLAKLTVEGGIVQRSRALYAALFTEPQDNGEEDEDEDGGEEGGEDGGEGSSSTTSKKMSSKKKKSSSKDKESSSGRSSPAPGAGPSTDGSGPKLAPALLAAVDALREIARDAPGQLAGLVALEWLLTVGAPDRQKEAPHAIKVLYDEDLADEDIIAAWHAKEDAGKLLDVPKGGAKQVRKLVQPIVDWLAQADSDEDNEEDDDE